MINISPAVQRLSARSSTERMEGVAFSSCGRLLAVATSEANNILLFRRQGAGERFEDEPYCAIDSRHGVSYPHDVAFSLDAGSRLLAVAQRGGSILVLERIPGSDAFGAEPATVISGPGSGLDFSDGVAFLPPDGDYLAACNLNTNTVCFYRNLSTGGSVLFDNEPFSTLHCHAMEQPDGLAFSKCGGFLAIANHGGRSVAVFRRAQFFTGTEHQIFHPQPVVIIRDAAFESPHSVAFTTPGDHLVVTNAGANYFSAYHCIRYGDNGEAGVSWSHEAATRRTLIDEEVFRRVNCRNKLEGGPKGIAAHGGEIAVCSPEAGVVLFRLDDLGPVRSREPVHDLGDDLVPAQAAGWCAEQLDDGALLRHEHQTGRFKLNGSALAVWQLCDGARTIGEMVAQLETLAGAGQSVGREIKQTVAFLDTHGLLSFRG